MVFNFYKCNVMENNFYDEKISLDQKEKYITLYELQNKGTIKEYWINNVFLTIRGGKRIFEYRIDKEVYYNSQDHILVHEYEISQCNPFNFYDPDTESECQLYENEIDSIRIQLKEYDDYLTIEYSCNSLDAFTKFNS